MVCIVILLINLILSPVAVVSNSNITINNSAAQMDFPLAINFVSNIKSISNISDVRLRYKIDQFNFADVTSEAYVDINPGTSVKAVYKLDLRKIGGLPPGTNVKYWWVVTDASGSVMESEPSDFQITDNRFTWHVMDQNIIHLYWYNGDDNFAASLMTTAQNAIKQLQYSTGAVPEKDIYIYIYADSKALQGSMIYPSEWTGGVAFTQYSIIAIGISTYNLSWGQRAMTHELTHNVIHQVTFNPYNGLPVWLNEGLAVNNEGPVTDEFASSLEKAAAKNSLLSVRSLCSPFSAYSDKAVLGYAESQSLVEYLLNKYGADKMQDLFNQFKNGSTYDDALQNVYGFNIEGLDAQWRLSIESLPDSSGTAH
jgi:hypothetical protein